ncbi:MAG: hypothetical protein WC792_03885 [Candidatus Micrarchaeia archaeon]|jgi:chromosome segregation ATPase
MGILDGILGKKPQSTEDAEAAEQAKIDAALKSSEELYEAEAAQGPPQSQAEESRGGGKGAEFSQVIRMQAQLDTLAAQIQALKEQRAIYDEKFARANESVGELRALMLDAEKDSQEIKVNAEKAVSLIEAVQPDKLLGEVRRVDSKTEELRARNEKNDAIQSQMTEDVKELKSKLIVFGTSEETLLKLQEEVKRELDEIKKSEGVIQRHSEKVEAIFAEVEKDFANYRRLGDQVQTVSDALRELVRDFDALRVRSEGFATKKEFSELKAATDEKIVEADKQLQETQGLKQLVVTEAQAEVERMKAEIAEKVSKLDESLSSTQSNYEKTAKLVDQSNATGQALRKELDVHTKKIEDKFEKFEEEATEYENRYDGLENEIAGVETRLSDQFISEGRETRKMLTKLQAANNAISEKYEDFKKRVQHSEKTTAALEREVARLKAKAAK